MVSGLFVPILGGLFWKKSNHNAAFGAMIGGGLTTAVLQAHKITFGTATSMEELKAFISKVQPATNFEGMNVQSMTSGKLVEAINRMQIIDLPFIDNFKLPLALDPNVFGILISAVIFVTLTLIYPKNR